MTGRCKRTAAEITRNICRTCVRCSLGIHAGSVFSNRVCVNPTDIYEAQITPELSIKLYLPAEWRTNTNRRLLVTGSGDSGETIDLFSGYVSLD